VQASRFVLVATWVATATFAQQIPQPPATITVEEPYAALAGRLLQAPDDPVRDALLAAQASLATRALVSAINETGNSHALRHDYAPARRAYAVACRVAQGIGDAHGELFCRVGQANCSLGEAHYDDALAAYDQLLQEAAARQDHAAMARVLHGIGLAYRSRSEHAEAESFYNRALAEAALAGDEEQTAQIEMHVGNLLAFLTRYREAT
jgi:tetratricopeptide (TPR) repeat protein